MTTSNVVVRKKSFPTNRTVTKSNPLVNACYSLNLTEKRLLAMSISRINSQEDKFPKKISVTASEYGEAFGCQNPYAELRTATDNLFERELNVYDESLGELSRIRWVQKVTYRKASGKVDIYFSDDIKQHLTSITGNFTTYQIKNIENLSSPYSIRIYELLKQYLTIGERTISVSELRSWFELEDKYKLFSDFRRYVIISSIKEINRYTDLLIDDPIYLKEGRNIVSISFKIRKKPQGELAI